MTSRGNVIAVACSILTLECAACGPDPGGGGGGGSGAQVDAGVVADARPPDAGMASQFVSNTPSAIVVDIGAPPTPEVKLISSNLLQKPSGTQVFQQWFGEIQNTGSTTICLVSIDVSFRDQSRAQVAVFHTFADGEPYKSSTSSLVFPCISPGQVGSLYDNAFIASAAPLESVTTIEVDVDSLMSNGAMLASSKPSLASQIQTSGTQNAISGTLTGRSEPIYAIRVSAYPRQPSGLVLGYLSDIALDTLQPDAVFPFTTDSIESSFTDYRIFVDFINGVRPAIAASSSGSALERVAAELADVRRQFREDALARLALANAR